MHGMNRNIRGVDIIRYTNIRLFVQISNALGHILLMQPSVNVSARGHQQYIFH